MKNLFIQLLLIIGKFVQFIGVSVCLIWYYDEYGLFVLVCVDNGYCLFFDKVVMQVKQIQCMIVIGFIFDDICGFLDCMLLIDGVCLCDQIIDVQCECFEVIDCQIVDFEKWCVRFVKMLWDGVVLLFD